MKNVAGNKTFCDICAAKAARHKTRRHKPALMVQLETPATEEEANETISEAEATTPSPTPPPVDGINLRILQPTTTPSLVFFYSDS